MASLLELSDCRLDSLRHRYLADQVRIDWKVVKHEGVYLWAYENVHELESGLAKWFWPRLPERLKWMKATLEPAG